MARPPSRAVRRHAGGSVLCAVLALATACGIDRAPRVGDPAPAFAAPDLEGGTLDLRQLRGEVLVVNVWATWCHPCRREMPALQELHAQLAARGLRVIGVSIDAAGAAPEIRAFLAEHAIDFTIVHDPAQRVTRAFATTGVPETFLIGRDGIVRHHWLGRIDARSPAVRNPVYDALDDAPLRHARR